MRVGNKLLNGRDSKVAKSIQKYADAILNGYFVAIDPASKEAGYAVFKDGELISNGEIIAEGGISERLRIMIESLDEFPEPQVVAVEMVGGQMMSHKYLIWSCGALVGTLNAPTTIEIPVPMWKKWIDENYTKTNINDALYIGKCVIEIAKAVE